MLTHLAVAGVHAHFHWPQLVLDLSSVKLAFFLLAHAGAETAFYLSVVAHSLPVAVLRVSVLLVAIHCSWVLLR
eukprot:scaffold273367_cov15-Tisochrysis_lutea.AAC.1